jgi:hypothetical protein
MGLFDFLKSKEEKEKEELLKEKSRFELEQIAKAKNIDMTELQTKDEYIKAIMNEGVSKSLIEKYSKVAKMVKGRTEILKPTESNVRRVINSWYPQRGQTHDALKNDLYLLFKKKFGDEYVRKESGQYRADIVIDESIPVELKVNFGGKAERNRLWGQITDYKKEYKGTIFLVICGINKLDDAWGEMKPQLSKDKQVETIIKFE